jgi:membrane associated rhomboid family serine protease
MSVDLKIVLEIIFVFPFLLALGTAIHKKRRIQIGLLLPCAIIILFLVNVVVEIYFTYFKTQAGCFPVCNVVRSEAITGTLPYSYISLSASILGIILGIILIYKLHQLVRKEDSHE